MGYTYFREKTERGMTRDEMGTYLNPSSMNFRRSINSRIYVDKSMLISFTNRLINTEQSFLCVSRPRRFGKTMAADMLAAYYKSGEDTSGLFDGLKIKEDGSFGEHINRYNVIKVDMQSFLNKGKTAEGLKRLLTEYIVRELAGAYPDIHFPEPDDLAEVLNNVFNEIGRQFIVIIDEWDCVMRRIHDWEEQKIYLDFIRDILKNQPYIALAYMTGILPIKKYGEHSTLNMFDEYSMTQFYNIVPYFGFTEEEVSELCERYNMSFAEVREWYDGYHFKTGKGSDITEYSMYSPRSVISAIENGFCDMYWTQTETYEALKMYIEMNYDGLRDTVLDLLAGNTAVIDTYSFQNDMTTFANKDDVLTLLLHLGYFSYERDSETIAIPNKEVARQFIKTIKNTDSYQAVYGSIIKSRELLNSLWSGDGEAVADGVEKAHQCFSSIDYNRENSLSCVVELAFYYAREYYTVIRELPSGKGFSDICWIPKPKHADKPAVIIELKWDKSAEAAIEQIKRKDYPHALSAYHGNLLLCGINYDKDDIADNKRHRCVIERLEL